MDGSGSEWMFKSTPTLFPFVGSVGKGADAVRAIEGSSKAFGVTGLSIDIITQGLRRNRRYITESGGSIVGSALNSDWEDEGPE